jgi:DNA repair exonuclease SbcCD ATPase subunit
LARFFKKYEGVSKLKLDLISLKLTNFMGVRSFEFNPSGFDTAIYGENGAGKSTLDHACQWLLFDKNADGQKDFALKTLDKNNNVIHHLDHVVEGTFSIDGRPLTLQKVFAEKWTQRRGSVVKNFTGHETTYFIDGVPVKKTEYDAKVKEIAPENIFKLLTNPSFFNTQMKWQDRRNILTNACGNVTDSDVIASNDKLKNLPEILGGRDMDKFKDMVAARKKKINEELKSLPSRIDENYRALPDLTGVDVNEIPGKIASLKARTKEKQAEISRIQGGGEVAEKTKALREVEGKLLDIRNQHREQTESKASVKRKELTSLNDELATLQQQVKTGEYALRGNEGLVGDLEKKNARLREEWITTDGQQFTFEQDENCPTCGQALPEERLTEAREKAQAAFNREKAERLEKITATGKKNKTEINRQQAENDSLKGKIKDLLAEMETVQEAAALLQDEISAITGIATDITENPAYSKAMIEKEALEREITSLKDGSTAKTVPLKAEIGMLETEIGSLERQLAQVDQVERGQKRIEELERQEKELAAEYERLEQQTFLCEEFIRAKAAMLEERINSKFKLARFKLFDQLVNGALAETCVTLCGGVPYGSGLNTGHETLVGLDIINTLAEHYTFYPMIFIDHAESVTSVLETHAQQIRLIAREGDKTLRVEYKNQIREAV